MGRRHALIFRLPALVLLLVLALPAIARAETYTFLNLSNLYPTGGALTEGPANVYPSNIVVSGISGTVTKATVTLIGYRSSRPDDADFVITGPNGQKVMLLGDTCGTTGMQNQNWVFDDAAPTFVSNTGPCASYDTNSYKPTNYLGNAEPDDLSPGGPAPPYLNALAFFAGAPPSGTWSLYALDDEADYFGFEIASWALTLQVEPPVQMTGQRAAALKKCKKKRGKARTKCKRRARQLPV